MVAFRVLGLGWGATPTGVITYVIRSRLAQSEGGCPLTALQGPSEAAAMDSAKEAVCSCRSCREQRMESGGEDEAPAAGRAD